MHEHTTIPFPHQQLLSEAYLDAGRLEEAPQHAAQALDLARQGWTAAAGACLSGHRHRPVSRHADDLLAAPGRRRRHWRRQAGEKLRGEYRIDAPSSNTVRLSYPQDQRSHCM